MSTFLDTLLHHNLIGNEHAVACEWSACKKLLRRVEMAAPDQRAALRDLDTLITNLATAAWDEGAKAGDALARAELAISPDTVLCQNCRGECLVPDSDQPCPECQGRGVIPALTR